MKTTDFPTARPFLPAQKTLTAMRAAMQSCKGCDLYLRATQAVPGRGPRRAKVMFVGEIPGNDEDKAGEPFVGPAGKLLEDALDEAGIDRREVYVTNAVKHFSYEPVGKRRIHKKPTNKQIKACMPWLELELELVKPDIVICLGATAAQALIAKDFKVTQHRGEILRGNERVPYFMATVHPSSVLRAPDDEKRREAREAFFEDVRKMAYVLRRLEGKSRFGEDVERSVVEP